MGSYILRRILLMIPTLVGIMAISFLVIQFAPGGPIEQVIASLQGEAGGAMDRVSGGGGDFGSGSSGGSDNSGYRGAQGLDPDFIERLEKQFGFDKPPLERFGMMLWNYVRFDFGDSYFRSVSVWELILEKMPVSISLGLWITLLSYLISIPLGIRKALTDGSSFDVWTSGVVIVAYAIPGFLFAIILIVLFAGGSFFDWFPLRGLLSDGVRGDWCAAWSAKRRCGPLRDADHPGLFLAPDAAADRAVAVGLRHDDAPDQELVPRRDPQAIRHDRTGQGSERERRVLYGHVFRNAMLIIVAGFPGAFISAFFAGSLLIETIFSLDGLGLLGFESSTSGTIRSCSPPSTSSPCSAS